MKKIALLTLLALFASAYTFAQQFDLSGEVRLRYENRNGFQTMRKTAAQNDANFVSQRTRLNFNYKNDFLKFKVVLQNVRVWGDVSTIATDDKNSAIHEAWADAKLSNKVSMKLGRQEIDYDDSRIFGNVEWAQQARSHDAFLLKIKPAANQTLDLGFALNADYESSYDQLYSNASGYKNFQYGWYHGDFKAVGLSILALNTGVEYLGKSNFITTDYMQTIGSRLTYKKDKISADAAAYVQTGKVVNTKVNASNLTVNASYAVNSNFSAAIGMEYLSGKDMNDNNAEIKSFTPLFGTNHKFNGLMDYFYVGNHNRSVGLMDLNASLGYKKDKFSMNLTPHLFSSAADVYRGTQLMDNNLGTEIDLTLAYKLNAATAINAGYSQMFATETMEVLKGGNKDITNNWAWIMITFKPQLFTHKAD